MHVFHVRYSQPFKLTPTFRGGRPLKRRSIIRFITRRFEGLLTFARGGDNHGPSLVGLYSTRAGANSPGRNKSGVSIELLNIVIQ